MVLQVSQAGIRFGDGVVFYSIHQKLSATVRFVMVKNA